MKFGITQESNLDTTKTTIINNLSLDINHEISSNDYGDDIKEFLIGIICVKPEFDQFFKVRKPRYIDHKTETHHGISIEILKSYGYDIKLDYCRLLGMNEFEIKRELANEILLSLVNLEKLPKKIRDFDSERFKSDLETFFKDRGLI